jgi:hypothetical protein
MKKKKQIPSLFKELWIIVGIGIITWVVLLVLYFKKRYL